MCKGRFAWECKSFGNPEGVHYVYLRSQPHPPLPLRFQCSPLPTTSDFSTCQSVALKGKLGGLGCVPWIAIQRPGVKGLLSAGLTFSMLSGLASISRCGSGGDNNIGNVDAKEYSKHWGRKKKPNPSGMTARSKEHYHTPIRTVNQLQRTINQPRNSHT